MGSHQVLIPDGMNIRSHFLCGLSWASCTIEGLSLSREQPTGIEAETRKEKDTLNGRLLR